MMLMDTHGLEAEVEGVVDEPGYRVNEMRLGVAEPGVAVDEPGYRVNETLPDDDGVPGVPDDGVGATGRAELSAGEEEAP